MSMAKVFIIGNVGREPESRYTQTGTQTVNFTVAVNNRRRNPDGSFQEETEWFRVTASGRLAEICQQYVTKGSQIFIEGRLRLDRWTGNDGQPRTTLDVFATDMQLLGSRQREDGGGFERPADPPQGAPRPANAPRQQPPDDAGDLEDLPF